MLELNRIYNMDCLDGMREIEDNTIDLVVTSPPYNLGIEYDSYNDKRSWQSYYFWCGEWIQEIYRILKPDGRFCLNHYLSCGTAEERSAPLMMLNCICDQIGFKHHGLAVWEDRTLTKRTAWGSWMSASAPYINSPYEGILISFKETWKKEISGVSDISKNEFMESCSGIWKLPTEHNGKTMANFPIALPERCIKVFSFKGDLVLDPFMGSGTTAYAAKLNERNFIGFEISKNYCQIAEKNLLSVMEQGKISEWF
jgi:site-specific DNA-methyltransferase (adenine-specific)